MKNKSLVIAIVALCVLMITSAAFAEQNGNERYGHADQYGVYVIEEDGSICYLSFWSEAARKYIMGALTPAGTGVVAMPEEGYSAAKFSFPNPNPVKAAPAKAKASGGDSEASSSSSSSSEPSSGN